MTNGNGGLSEALKGRVALVTGAARGIGRAIALHLAASGAAVAANYRTSKAEAQSLAEQIHEMHADCILVPGDVASSEEAQRVVQEVLDSWGRIEVLVNNAGITRNKSLRRMANDEWADVINVNLNGTYYCTAAVIPGMIKQRYGRIVNISSHVGQAGSLEQANYAASNGGIIAFTKALALEMAAYNITANTVAPGFTSTEMLAQIPPHVLVQIQNKIPLGRFARPEEIASAVGFLVAHGDYITGQQLNINGGLYM